LSTKVNLELNHYARAPERLSGKTFSIGLLVKRGGFIYAF